MTVTLAPSLSAAARDGATIVTPNNRLARRLRALYDDAQRSAGLRTWQAASILPWPTWLGALWLELIERAPQPSTHLLSTAQSSLLWRTIVGADSTPSASLLDVGGAVDLAQRAWTTVHSYGAGGESWRGFAAQGDDEAAFVRWADRYSNALARLGFEDLARAADGLARAAQTLSVRERAFVLAGFLELDPQQQRLVAALQAAGARVARVDTLPAAGAQPVRFEARSPRDELGCALEWARQRAIADPQATIALAIEGLAERRAEVIALADDVLCPQWQWPGFELVARPYNVSLGTALAEMPIVASAIDLIALADASLPVERAAALVRSPYLPGASAHWPQRAAAERRWLDEGRRDVDWPAFASALARDPALGQRSARMHRPATPVRRAAPRAFAQAWRAWLADVGWPGDRALASAEFQAQAAFDELLATFVSLTPVSSEMTASEALAALRTLAADAVFQPKAPRAPIQIMGLLEAAGMPCDALWIVGLSAQRWPAAPRPHPLLPLDWQRERNVPHASAARELASARSLTDQLARGAAIVVASHALTVDDHACVASALTSHWPLSAVVVPPRRSASIAFDERPPLERIVADRAPPIAVNEAVRGGANLVETQSECPFRAVACYRLRTDVWPPSPPGLTALERGSLLHAALAAFWRDTRTHGALVALAPSELDARIAAAVAEAMSSKLDARRARALPPLVLAGEPARLAALIRQWIDACERGRPAFAVRAVEHSTEIALGGIRLSIRLDRVDALADGGAAIIDYKSGEVPKLARTFEPRPAATQLAVYALAWRAAERETPLRAVAFAQVSPDAIEPSGIAADAAAWPGLKLAHELPENAPHDWGALIAAWHDAMSALARDFAAGEAGVDPRETDVCKRCGMQALCRIDAAPLPFASNDDA